MSTSNDSKQKERLDSSADMEQDHLDEKTSDAEPDFIFDVKKQYYPLFYLTEIPAGVRLLPGQKYPHCKC